ncbi:Pentatricopeptide repeat [Macleaya cordata]|uniref:Pentatricopeptide repeat n=1 Tax=Macleaya cordata TaxID=56857 RepID=A0A200QLX8_MACCD|nr:Pentatricopeptide repeat [Macleaya cordata]
MLAKYSLLRNWKHRRWKNSKFYSTLQQNSLSQSQIVSSNISIANYAREGDLDIARKIFDEMPVRTVVTFNTMISCYSKWGKFKESLDIVSKIHCVVLKSGSENFELVGSSLLNFYANCYEIGEARRVFDLHERNGLLWNLMLVGFVHCNLMKDAMELFAKMPVRDVVSWTALISGYSRSEDECEEAFKLFKLMRVSGEAKPNEFTLDSVLRACCRLGVLNEGKMVHGLLINYGFEIDHSVGGALIEFYCNCDAIEDAKRVYERLANPCLNSSNSLIGGLVAMGRIDDAEMIFSRMESNPVAYNLMIKGYAMSGRIDDSKRLFGELPHKTIVTLNTMISVYSRNGELGKAFELFEQTKEWRNPVTWNSMISALIQNNRPEEALKLYVTMHRLPVERNRSTFSTLFHACSSMGSLQQGKLLHGHLIKTPFESNVYVGTSLVDMYAKCGNITDARRSFTDISSPNVAAWTSLINGYGYHGLGTEAILLFDQMLDRGVYPNAVTFVGLLLACGHSGLVDEGMKFFHSMKKEYGVEPTIEHYACVVDLLGRSGYLKEAEDFINRMPLKPDWIIWGSLLSSCWSWMDMEVGKRVAERMFNLNPKQISAYVIMSNIYAAVGKWGEVVKVRKKLRGMKVKKDPGCSWIEVKNNVHVFCVEDRTHPQCNEILTILEDLRSEGDFNLSDNDNSAKSGIPDSIENVTLKKFKEDMKNLPEDRGFDEFIDCLRI